MHRGRSGALLTAAVALTVAGCSFSGGLVSTAPAGPTPAGPAAAGPTSTGPTSTGPTSAAPTTSAPPVPAPTSAPVSTPPVSAPATAPHATSRPASPAPVTSRPVAAPPATSPPAAPAPAASPTGPPQPCRTDQLVAALSGAASPGAGRAAATVVLTNLSSLPCTLVGYGGISLRRSDGGPIPSSQVRTATPAPARQVLAPGLGVRSTISWATVADPGVGEPADAPCEPTPTTLQVIPPNQVPQLAVPWTAGPVCGQGAITQSAYAR